MLMIQNSDKSNNLQLVLITVPNLLLVLVTVAYVLLTQKLVKTNQALFDIQTSPSIIAYLKIIDREKNKHIDLIIDNVGSGPARNVIFNINPSGLKILSGDFDLHSLIQNGISVLGPKQRMSITLCYDMSRLTSSGNPERFFIPLEIPKFHLTITYQNFIGKNIGPEQFDIDIGMFKNQ